MPSPGELIYTYGSTCATFHDADSFVLNDVLSPGLFNIAERLIPVDKLCGQMATHEILLMISKSSFSTQSNYGTVTSMESQLEKISNNEGFVYQESSPFPVHSTSTKFYKPSLYNLGGYHNCVYT